MIGFIKQEAIEKAREIKVKADEEFAIEKAKIVRQETQNIDAEAERKRKQAETQKRIAKSTATNKARLRVLEAREQMLDDVFQTARKQLESIAQDGDKYGALLKNLILQALYSLMETEVVVKSRKQDADAVKKAADEAASEFKDAIGHEVKFSVESELSDDLAGGVIVTASRGKLVVNNTLDERLRLTEDRMLPEIREQLFGQNPNRVHDN